MKKLLFLSSLLISILFMGCDYSGILSDNFMEVESVESNSKVVSQCVAPLVNASIYNNKPRLSWVKVEGAVKYQIYEMNTYEHPPWTLRYLAETISTYYNSNEYYGYIFSDSPLIPAVSYRVYAIDKYGRKSPLSNQVFFRNLSSDEPIQW